jgi:hypothetical protein
MRRVESTAAAGQRQRGARDRSTLRGITAYVLQGHRMAGAKQSIFACG